MNAKTLTVLAILLCAAGGALALANGGGGEEPRRAAARADVGEPLEIALKPAHRSGVSGTARLVPGRSAMTVTLTIRKHLPATLTLRKRPRATLLTHIHTGPCSDEPTWSNPRIWANLTDVVDGRSKTTVNVVTLDELRAEGASINVHDPDHNQRPLACGDIPRESEEGTDAP